MTADNRYKLYLNGRFVSLGPARGDIYNWNFETVDLAPYLIKGKNVLAAVIWNYAEQKPVAQISFNQTGFLLQGNTEVETVVNTDASWLCMKNFFLRRSILGDGNSLLTMIVSGCLPTRESREE